MPTNITKFIHFHALIISFLLGLVAVYFTTPVKRVIVVTPSPENVDKIQYKDETDHYFQFKEEKVKCSDNATNATKTLVN